MHYFIYYIIAFLWALFTGLIFSLIGAAGGILASFGFVAILHVPVANSIKVMSLILVVVSPLIAVPVYLKQRRVVLSLGFLLAFGSIFGALLGSWFSKNYLSELKSFKYLFGYLTFVVAILMIYNLIKQKIKKKSQDVKLSGFDINKDGVKTNKFSFKKIEFRFLSKEYSFSPVLMFLLGFLVAIISSIFGVGGGFLIVPYLTDISGMPMFVVAGTSALVVLISALTGITSYISMGVSVILILLVIMVAGVIIGSWLGPQVSKFINEKWLKYILIGVLFFIGFFYILKL